MGFFERGYTRPRVRDVGTQLEVTLSRPPDGSGLIYVAVLVFTTTAMFAALTRVLMLATLIRVRHTPGVSHAIDWLTTAILLSALAMIFLIGPFYILARFLGSSERVVVSPETVSIAKRVAWLGRPRHYTAYGISGLRFGTAERELQDTPTGPPTLRRESWLEFKYGGKVIIFGAGLDEPEAEKLVERLAARIPGN